MEAYGITIFYILDEVHRRCKEALRTCVYFFSPFFSFYPSWCKLLVQKRKQNIEVCIESVDTKVKR